MNVLFTSNICEQISPILGTIGQALRLFKIAIPFILIVLCTFDLSKAVISSKNDDIKKNLKMFSKRIVVAISLFFIPLVVMIIFGFVEGFNEAVSDSGIDYDVCYNCLFNPNKLDCGTLNDLNE